MLRYQLLISTTLKFLLKIFKNHFGKGKLASISNFSFLGMDYRLLVSNLLIITLKNSLAMGILKIFVEVVV